MASTDARTCDLCGEKTENGRSAVCYGCYLTGEIQNIDDFQKREKYEYAEEYGHRNATDRPAAGHPWLDGTPLASLDPLAGCTPPPRSDVRRPGSDR